VESEDSTDEKGEEGDEDFDNPKEKIATIRQIFIRELSPPRVSVGKILHYLKIRQNWRVIEDKGEFWTGRA
jgi:hypothetical protein